MDDLISGNEHRRPGTTPVAGAADRHEPPVANVKRIETVTIVGFADIGEQMVRKVVQPSGKLFSRDRHTGPSTAAEGTVA